MNDRVSKESKLTAAKDIVASYVKSKEDLSVDDVCEALRKVYGTISDLTPDEQASRVGLA